MLEENVKRWMREQEERGIRIGRQRGEADLLTRMASRRFGGLDEASRARIESADADQLLEWGERLLTARRPEDLFST